MTSTEKCFCSNESFTTDDIECVYVSLIIGWASRLSCFYAIIVLLPFNTSNI